ncbi:hypothetical protein Cgig2_033068 [Carnegiea gigantea]|uniref:Delta(14)-sterol reductase n=1 Tax=Carnegiea gigantea TaxID=171969 RepID=A0A9Q1JGF7_9CARY|nr:hypothetical protein Cgig2_033068 [Carnegiea gigantea]
MNDGTQVVDYGLQTLWRYNVGVVLLLSYIGYLAIFGSLLPGKVVPGVTLADGTCIHYRCNGLLSLVLLVLLLGGGVAAGVVSPTVIAERGLELLIATSVFSFIVTLFLYLVGRISRDSGSSLKPHVSGNFIHDWWFGIQLNPQFMGIDLKYLIFRGANKQKHVFKKNPKAPIWGRPPKVIGGKLLASGYWGIARHCNYLGDLLLALSFSLPCGISSPIPYFYPIYLLILLIWRERRDEARCAEKYRGIWAEYRKTVPWRILPYVY